MLRNTRRILCNNSIRATSSRPTTSTTTTTMSRHPLIAVVGSTGTGKSELAVNLAKHYNGEIINGDAMQLYQGLPIITNKMPVPERLGVPHHLLGEIGLDEQTWTVSGFVAHALAKIKDIRARGKLPILVGGTHYYTQSLLFEDALAEGKDEMPASQAPSMDTTTDTTTGPPGTTADADDNDNDNATKWPILSASPSEILSELRRVDPIMADRWHPNDHRKIKRSLEIYLQTGRPASTIYAEQKQPKESTSSSPSASLRTPTLVLWVHARAENLVPRLDSRVDKMLSLGLLDEVSTLSSFATNQQIRTGTAVDTSRGIYVSIGYKEFMPYQTAISQQHQQQPSTGTGTSDISATPPSGSSSQEELQSLLAVAIEKTKIATRQYSKRQTRWIRIKLRRALSAANASSCFFLLDASNLDEWKETVSDPGISLVGAFLQQQQQQQQQQQKEGNVGDVKTNVESVMTLPDPKSLSDLAREMLQGDSDNDNNNNSDNADKEASADEAEGGRGGEPQKKSGWTRQYCEICDMVGVTESDWKQHMKSRRHRISLRKQSRNAASAAAGEEGLQAEGRRRG